MSGTRQLSARIKAIPESGHNYTDHGKRWVEKDRATEAQRGARLPKDREREGRSRTLVSLQLETRTAVNCLVGPLVSILLFSHSRTL